VAKQCKCSDGTTSLSYSSHTGGAKCIKAANNNVNALKGRPTMVSDEEANDLLEFYVQIQECGIPVSFQLLAIELQRFSPRLDDVSVVVLCCHILCIMKTIMLLTINITRHKIFTLSSLFLWTLLFTCTGRLSVVGTWPI
jgi:hypothetical protein